MEKGNVVYKFKFSIIIAVYNVDQFLEETIESVTTQSIGFEDNVQLILIDDGSTDESGKICDEYQNRYPNNVICVHKTNGGVSSARNIGLQIAEGEYINCLDGDDKLSQDTLEIVYLKCKEWDNKTDIITIPLYFFDGKTGGHILNNKFNKGSRVINLNEEYDKPLFSLSASFVKNSVLKKFEFDERLSHAEDGKIVLQILLDKQCYGVVKEARYLYRRRTLGPASAIQSSLKNKRWYNNYMTYFALWTLENCNKIMGRVPLFVQYELMYDLQWRFRSEQNPLEILSEEENDLYFKTIKKVLSYIDDQIILAQKQLFIDHKFYILKLKYGHGPEIEQIEKDIYYSYGGEQLYKASNFITVLEFFEALDNGFTIEGRMSFPGYNESDSIKIWISVNGELVECSIEKRNNILLSMGKNISYILGFKANIIPKKKKINEIKFICEVNGTLVEKRKMSYGKFFPLTNRMWNSYFVSQDFILRYVDNTLYLYPYSKVLHLYREISFLKRLWRLKNKAAKKAFVIRILYYLNSILRHNKEVWLISDRINKADDNGEVLFQHLLSHPIEGVEPVFAISRNSQDYSRLKKIGKVIDFNGRLYKWLYLNGAKIISSQGEDYIFRPFAEYSYCYADLIQKSRFVFLQHGITKDDLSRWLKRGNKNISTFITATIPEYNSILGGDYGYTSKEVKLTGFPRYDRLYNDEKRRITIMPSWRAYLVGDVDIKTGRRVVLNSFEESIYRKMYSQLLTNNKLINRAKNLGYEIYFMSHPNMIECTKMLDKDPYIKVEDNDKITYRKIFAESSLIVTDYSSVFFDFAYLNKPILYYQADNEEFFGGSHTYDKGYFNYETDGFGEVAYTVEQIVDLLIEYMENNCIIKDKYQQRINDTFRYHDQRNCLRVCEEILKIDKNN